MANEPDSIVLAILRKIDQRTERMAEDRERYTARLQAGKDLRQQ
ncbi:hypothetical protein [Bradyrhizobium murdochi]|nr:hypothetical protein [Bradyrhizobium murdochi]